MHVVLMQILFLLLTYLKPKQGLQASTAKVYFPLREVSFSCQECMYVMYLHKKVYL